MNDGDLKLLEMLNFLAVIGRIFYSGIDCTFKDQQGAKKNKPFHLYPRKFYNDLLSKNIFKKTKSLRL